MTEGMTLFNCYGCGAKFTSFGARANHGKYSKTCTAEMRYWGKVDKRGPDECWPWIGAITSHGYGCTAYKGKVVGAHKVAYMLTNGDVPAGLEIMHSCDNRPCCNPAHLTVGTRQDNIDDKVRKGRTAKHSKKNTLSPDDVREIRSLRGIEPSGSLAKRFNVEQPHIINIWNRKCWRSV